MADLEVSKLDAVQQGQETMLLAMSPDELQAAHGTMRTWAAAMADLMRQQREDLQQAMNVAARSGWDFTTIERHKAAVKRRENFYQKILAALDAGYLMVPNFQMTPWVVRTNKVNPSGDVREQRWSVGRWYPQQAGRLPIGEGRFVGHNAKSQTETVEGKDEKGNAIVLHRAWPVEFDDAPPFPMVFAAPHVMERASGALRELIFDEIGVSDDGPQARRGDPFLLGRIINPRRGRPDVTFFIAWSMDLRRL